MKGNATISLQKGNEARAEEARAAAILRVVDGTQKMAGEDQGSEEDFLSSPVAPALRPAINTHQFPLLRNKLGVERNPGTILCWRTQREPPPLQQQGTARAGGHKASANPPLERTLHS